MFLKENIPPLHKSDKLEIRLHVDSQHTYYGMPYASQGQHDLMSTRNEAGYVEEMYYINYTFRNVSVMDRNGLSISVPYTSSSVNSNFIIRKIITLKSVSLESAINSIKSISHIDGAELQEIKQSLLNIDKNSYKCASIMIDYSITMEDFKSKDGTLYHYQTDLVLSLKDTVDMDPHPYSARFLNIGTFGVTNNYSKQKEFNLKIRYVNHTINATPVYINLAGKVYTLYPQKDAPSRRITFKPPGGKVIERVYDDYIQVFHSAHCDPDVFTTEGVIAIRMTLEDAKEKMGIYNTYADALASGNIELNRKEEVLKLHHQLEIMKQNFIIEKAKYDKEELQRKEALLIKEHDLELIKREAAALKQNLEISTTNLNITIAENKKKQTRLDVQQQELENDRKRLEFKHRVQDNALDRENKEFNAKLTSFREDNEHRLKMEGLYWKDFYENRSLQRKDTSDIIKFVPGLLIGVAGIAAAWIKFSNTKSD